MISRWGTKGTGLYQGGLEINDKKELGEEEIKEHPGKERKPKEKSHGGKELGKAQDLSSIPCVWGNGELLGQWSNLRLGKLEGQNVFVKEKILKFILSAIGNHRRAFSVDVTKSCSCL